MAQLMFRIANEPHADILSIKANLPACLVAIINRSLAKQVEDRYANGAEMADVLRQCAALARGTPKVGNLLPAEAGVELTPPVGATPRSGDPSAASNRGYT